MGTKGNKKNKIKNFNIKMFFRNKYRQHKKTKQIHEVFSKSYEITKNVKLSKYVYVPLFFTQQKVCVIYGEYDNTKKNIIELEHMGIRVFNIPKSEDIITSFGRLLYVLKNI